MPLKLLIALLTEPLSSWQLRYYAAQPLTIPLRYTGLYAAITGLGVVLFALGGYVLTHLQRQIRLAKSRVTFAGQVSHELRTPLTNIRLYTELAQADLQTADATATQRIAGRLAIIDGESRRLSRLVSGVMEVIREDEGKRPLRLHPHNADAVIARRVARSHGGDVIIVASPVTTNHPYGLRRRLSIRLMHLERISGQALWWVFRPSKCVDI
jgi:signal transduction histidine kinase